MAVQTFIDGLDDELVAIIDPDDFFDFQVRRPTVSLGPAGVRSITWPRNEVYALHAPERDLVVVVGEEPHYRWRVFTEELVEALASLGVSQAVTLGSFIGQVAHTLPVPLVASATRPEALHTHRLHPSGYEGPTGIVGVLNSALGGEGIEVISVWAAVPHYLSNQEYPPAAEALVLKASELLGVSVDIGDLVMASRQFLDTVNEAIEGNEELLHYVEQLEQEAEIEAEESFRLVEEIEDFLRGQP